MATNGSLIDWLNLLISLPFFFSAKGWLGSGLDLEKVNEVVRSSGDGTCPQQTFFSKLQLVKILLTISTDSICNRFNFEVFSFSFPDKAWKNRPAIPFFTIKSGNIISKWKMFCAVKKANFFHTTIINLC